MPRLKDFLELHFVIFLWGFTAILGKLISIPAVELVAVRTLITALALGLIIYRRGTPFRLGRNNTLRIFSVGFLIAALLGLLTGVAWVGWNLVKNQFAG